MFRYNAFQANDGCSNFKCLIFSNKVIAPNLNFFYYFLFNLELSEAITRNINSPDNLIVKRLEHIELKLHLQERNSLHDTYK